VEASEEPARKKRRKHSFAVPQIPGAVDCNWVSEFNLDGKVIKTLDELGDGGSSRVYKGFLAEKVVAVKKLKFYSVRFASSLIAAYEGLFELSHPNVTKVLGICPKEGYIVMECCEKVVNGVTVRTLADLIRHFGTSLPIDLRITAIADIADGVHYLHENGVIHGDIKPLNVLVCGGNESDDFCFKITDYARLGNKIAAPSSSKSVTLKQLMTPAYTAPELFSEDGAYSQPTASSDIYSLGILAYEIILGLDPWKHVSFDLIERVKHGYRPVIPEKSPKQIAAVIERCWLHNHLLRPSALEISQELEHYLEYNADSTFAEVDDDEAQISSFHATEPPPSDDDDRLGHSCIATETSSNFSEMELPVSSTPLVLDYHSNVEVQHASHLYNTELPHASPSRNTDISCPLISNDTSVSHLDSIDTPQSASVPWSPDNIATAKSKLNIRELKEFQTECLAAINRGDDVIVVQPTGSGKSVCFTLPALLSPGKVSLVIEPAVAIIINQVETLCCKGIDAIALGNAAGNKTARSLNYRRLFKECSDLPQMVFCTPEYLFGTHSTDTHPGTSGMFHLFLGKSEIFCMVTIDEAHKIFDRMPDYRPTIDGMKQLKKLMCPIVAMSATLTEKQINELRQEYLRDDKCVILTNSVSRNNLQVLLQRYRRRRCQPFAEVRDNEDCDDNDDENYEQIANHPSSMWEETVSKILPLMRDHSTVLYLDFVKDVEDVTDVIKRGDVNVSKYTGKMNVDVRKETEKQFLQGKFSVLVATEAYELGVDNPNISQVVRIGCPRNLGVLLQELGRAGRKLNSTAVGLLLFNEVQDDK